MQRSAYNDNCLQGNKNAPKLSDKEARGHDLARLKQVIQKLEKPAETELDDPNSSPNSTHQGINAAAPSFSPDFPAGHSHEIWAARPADYAAAMGFVLGALTHTKRPILWITNNNMLREHGMLYGPGLLGHGINPANLIIIRCKREKDALWAMEEGLKSTALSAVIGELTEIDLKSSRRLSLATRAHKSRCLLLLRRSEVASSACYSRWQILPSNSTTTPLAPHAPGAAGLEAKLVKHRGGLRPTTTQMEWQHAPDSLPMVAALANRAVDESPAPAPQHATG